MTLKLKIVITTQETNQNQSNIITNSNYMNLCPIIIVEEHSSINTKWSVIKLYKQILQENSKILVDYKMLLFTLRNFRMKIKII